MYQTITTLKRFMILFTAMGCIRLRFFLGIMVLLGLLVGGDIRAQDWEGSFTISPVSAPEMVLEVVGAGTADGTAVSLGNPSAELNKVWVITPKGDGFYTVRPTYSTTLVLTVSEGKTDSGTAVVLETDSGKPWQLWSVQNDSAAASYGTTYFDGQRWHMFYLGTPHTTPAPDYIPGFPYLTMKAESAAPTGPWNKQYDVTPFRVKTNSYYAGCASPGYITKHGDEYLMFFSASTEAPIFRTLSLARTRDLNGPWTLAAQPLLPPTEQVENSSLYFEKKNKTWFLFTDHVGTKDGLEYTDAIWVYWSKDLTQWNPAHKAVVLDSRNCKWSKHIIGLPSVVPMGKRLAIFYDGQDADPIPPGVKSHMNRDIGLAWLDLPLSIPVTTSKRAGVIILIV